VAGDIAEPGALDRCTPSVPSIRSPATGSNRGGVELFVIGYTEGGAPYGLTREEYEQRWEDDRESDEHNASSADHDVSGRAAPRARRSVETPLAYRPDQGGCESVSASERGELAE
jgi:hypothetical protein